MAKKKKHGHLNTKQSRAENYNKFLRGIDVLLAKMNVSIRTKDMPAIDMAFMYKNKSITPCVECEDLQAKKNPNYKAFVDNVDVLIRYAKFKMDLDWYDEEISYKDLYTDWLNFSIFCDTALSKIKNINENDKLIINDFIAYFNQFADQKTVDCTTIVYTSTMCYSDLFKEIIWGTLVSVKNFNNKPSPFFKIQCKIKKVEQKVFLKDEFNRIGCKVYSIPRNGEPIGIKINLKKLGMGRDKEMDVYFQKHVYERLYERLDAADPETINIELIVSLIKVEYVVNDRNSKLIVYKYLGKTLGYFTFRILQDAILCTTFLFITNDSTPEGEKLNELTHLQKADKQYFKLDKLSAFAASDLRDNPKLMELFKKAGCAHLFEDEYKPIFRKVEFNKMADKLINYIDTDDEEEDH